MDINSIISGGLSGTILAGFYIVYKVIKKSKCRSNCCGRESSMSIDLGSNNSSPPSVQSNQHLQRPLVDIV
jgi:hypothetical protein